jgi:hypothetical protein
MNPIDYIKKEFQRIDEQIQKDNGWPDDKIRNVLDGVYSRASEMFYEHIDKAWSDGRHSWIPKTRNADEYIAKTYKEKSL